MDKDAIGTERRVLQINTSQGGVPKRSERSVQIEPGSGIASDRQADRVHHGGPRQDLLLFRLETILQLQSEGHPVYPGSVGENITLVGCTSADMRPGTRLLLGDDVEVELTDYAPPCRKIAGSFLDRNFNRINPERNAADARVYARVLAGGSLVSGAPVRILERGDPEESD